jgi:hypothetical protein
VGVSVTLEKKLTSSLILKECKKCTALLEALSCSAFSITVAAFFQVLRRYSLLDTPLGNLSNLEIKIVDLPKHKKRFPLDKWSLDQADRGIV